MLRDLEDCVAAGRITDARALSETLHQVAGTAALFGLPELGQAAHELQKLSEWDQSEQIRRAETFLDRVRTGL